MYVCIYVCLSVGVRKLQVAILLDRLGKCLKLFVSSDSISCHEFASQFGLAFFYMRKTFINYHEQPFSCKFLLNEKGRNAGLAVDRSTVFPTSTRAVNVVSSDRFSQHGENNKSKRRQRELYRHGLKNVV